MVDSRSQSQLPGVLMGVCGTVGLVVWAFAWAYWQWVHPEWSDQQAIEQLAWAWLAGGGLLFTTLFIAMPRI